MRSDKYEGGLRRVCPCISRPTFPQRVSKSRSPLLNQLWDVLARQRVYPVVVSGDIRQAFLRVRESERDALIFHWRSQEEKEVETYRFTRVVFGLTPSSFFLNAVLEAHLDSWKRDVPTLWLS